MSTTLQSLLNEIAPLEVLASGGTDFTLSAVTDDSRRVVPGAMFVAVAGTGVDGHDFIPGAVEAGAAAIVCERIPENPTPNVAWVKVADSSRALGQIASAWYGHPSRKLTLVGVTGTNGKTTIASLLFELARIGGIKAGLLSTVANHIDDIVEPATHTTPGQLQLNALLARMVEHGCTFAAMEVSSHAASQNRIAGLDFDGAVFTNLTRDHLDYHKTFANYLAAKKSFFDSLRPGAFALTNADDRNGSVMLQNCAARHFTYSIRSDADFRGKVIEDRLDGMLMAFNGIETETRFAGRFNASNLTAVFGAASLLGWNADGRLPIAMSMLVPVAGRFQPFTSADGVTAIVDYAHTPDALANVLDTINEIKRSSSRVITVCGAGGDRDHGKRPLMAREAALRSDIIILTSDNPRSEDPAAIIAQMKEGLDPEALKRTFTNIDRAEAIRMAVTMAEPDDVVLVAGKGHEDYQVLATGKIHFDDREQVAEALNNRNS